MRVLIYSKDIDTNEFKDIIEYFKSTQLAIVDVLDDIQDATYCIEIRDYDYIVLDLPNKFEKYLNLLKSIKVKESKISKILILNSKYDIEKYDYYLKDNDVSLSPIEEIIPSLNLEDTLTYNNIQLKITGESQISFFHEGETIIKEFKKLEFLIILYFIRHYGETIHIDRLIEATVQEPEFEKKSSIESAISSIKKVFNSTIEIVPIINIKKKGYLFEY